VNRLYRAAAIATAALVIGFVLWAAARRDED
jgi:hypothetical protein